MRLTRIMVARLVSPFLATCLSYVADAFATLTACVYCRRSVSCACPLKLLSHTPALGLGLPFTAETLCS